MRLAPRTVQELFAECARAFPEEACGVIVGPGDEPEAQRFVAFDNLATRLHEADPVAHPRDGRTAFAMHPLKLQRLVDEVESVGDVLVAICHSHPQHPAYFSKTDRAAASPFGTPTYPGAVQVVVSVFDGAVVQVAAFRWTEGDWAEVVVGGLPALAGPPPGATELGDV